MLLCRKIYWVAQHNDYVLLILGTLDIRGVSSELDYRANQGCNVEKDQGYLRGRGGFTSSAGLGSHPVRWVVFFIKCGGENFSLRSANYF